MWEVIDENVNENSRTLAMNAGNGVIVRVERFGSEKIVIRAVTIKIPVSVSMVFVPDAQVLRQRTSLGSEVKFSIERR